MRAASTSANNKLESTGIVNSEIETSISLLARLFAREILKELLSQWEILSDTGELSKVMAMNSNQQNRKEVIAYSPVEAARLLGLSRSAIYNAVRKNQLPNIRIGRRILIPRIALNKYLENADKETPSCTKIEKQSQVRY